MAVSLFNLAVTHKDRLATLKQQAPAHFDLRFLKALAPQDRSPCLDLLEASHSQIRQDIFALAMNGYCRDGFFVEFGATDGVSLNNTLMLERDFGWTGILAEPARDWHDALGRNRACKIDTRCVWRSSGETLRFTEAPRGENSGLTQYVGLDRRLRGKSYDVTTVSLNDLLAEHGAPAEINYASIDTEGSEYEILKALDWGRWSFKVLTVEHNHGPRRGDIHALLTGHGYRRVLEEVSNFDDWYLGPSV